ncbi:dihydroneopterin aldolase [Sulfurospirillum arsenophilum]|uniref:dihydroneopterin aldolase n=1 Tax=Sulfurospirillum arsenophilum TaxID=56698 RepID=UPI0012EB4835|nr:dihydroneopterin aldolase [Sulfurospirillum arsenophilum]
MEFLELTLLIISAFTIWKKPEKEARAFKLLVGVFVVVAFIFFAIDLQFFILPPINL